MARIIFVSVHNDEHLSFVKKHLNADDEVIRIDPIDILKGKTLDYEFKDSQMRVYYKGKALEDISGVWYRRPTLYTLHDIPVEEEEKEYAFSSLTHHIRAFAHLLPEALWVSDPAAIRRTSSKPLQLVLAFRLGFNVPDTLFATDGKRAKTFVKEEKVCIAKTLATAFPPKRLAFAKVIRPEDKLNYDGLRVDPFIFQTLIRPAAELRITVVGDQVFAAKVEGMEAQGRVSEFRDWRYGHVDGSFTASAYDLPQEQIKQCIALVKAFGLKFGAIDMIVDKQDKYWFLEINPNGQWAFIEHITGQPIGKAIALMLQRGKQGQGV